MPNLLEQAASWLADVRKAHLSSVVTYCRGESTVQVAATVGSTTFDVDDGFNAIERWESRDFLTAAVDLVLDGQVTLPQAGDRIKQVLAGQTLVYEVMAPGKEHVWRFSDAYRNTLRIHTKQVDTE